MSMPVTPAIRHADRLYIGGRWVAPQVPALIEVISPDTEQCIARVAEARAADMDAAVAAARGAFDEGPWPHLAAKERIGLLRALAGELQRRQDELASAWTLQVGGLVTVAPMVVGQGTQTFVDVAEVGERFLFERRVDSALSAMALLVHEPVGVVAAIAPWNAPYAIMASKVATALLAGCTVIMKPAPETPLEAYIIAECAEKVGLPPGVVNLVPAYRDAADHLVCNPGVDKVGFTGSTAAGRRIASVCGDRIARCTLELGGKSAAIVLDDYDVQAAAQTLTQAITLMSGQVCAALSRVIVPARRHDELADAIAAQMRSVRVGHSSDPRTQMGPLAMRRQLERVQGYVEAGRSAGAKLVCGGGRPAGLERGYFIEPTLFAAVDNRSRIAQEEIFGPVLALIPARDVEDAIRIANESPYGLNGAVFTHDAEAAYRIGRRIRTGNVSQSGLKADFRLPFGGFKQSGCGREGGMEGLLSYLETKTLLLDAAPQTIGGRDPSAAA